MVPPNGPAAARSRSTWIHWSSPVAAAKPSMRSCPTSIQDDGPNSSPGCNGSVTRPSLSRLLDRLVEIRPAARHERRADALRDALLRDHALGHVAARRKLEHDVEKRTLDDRAKPAGAGLALERLVGDLPQGVLGEDELDRVVSEEPLVLLDERVLRLGQDLDEILAAQLVHRRDDRQAADELRDETEVEEVLRHHLREQLGRLDRMLRAHFGAEADGVLPDALGDDPVEAGERAAADEEDVRRVDRQELLVRMLAPALRRDGGDRPLEDLQQCLLDALTRDVTRDRRVVRLARDLVDLVDVDDPGLGLLDVEVGRLDQLQEDVLDVLADVARLGQRGRVGDGERHVENASQGLGQQRLAAPGRPEEQDVRLLQLDVVLVGPHLDALVVVVHRHRQRPLGLLLRYDVVVQDRVDVPRTREVVEVELSRGGELLVDDLVAEIDALVADVDAGTGDQLLDLPLALPAEAAEELFVALAGPGHNLSLYLGSGPSSTGGRRRCRRSRTAGPRRRSCSSPVPCPWTPCRPADSCAGR